MTLTYGAERYGTNRYGLDRVDMAPTTYGMPLREWGAFNYGGAIDEQTSYFTVEIEVAGEWVDVTCDVRTITISSGRSAQLDSFTAATCVVELADFDDRYNAWSPSSLWALNGVFRTDVPIRVRTTNGGIALPLFTGTTDAVLDSWPDTTDALTQVQSTDAFKGLARNRPAKLGAAVGAGELSGARITRILDACGYSGPRAIDAGESHWAATVLDGVGLDLIDEVREGEWGELYVAGDGAVTFRERGARSDDPRMAQVVWTFTDVDQDDADPSWTCYSSLVLTANDERVVNSASVQNVGGLAQVSSTADSVGWYGPRTWTKTNYGLSNDADALILAQAVVADHAYNERRVDAITFYPLNQRNGQHVASGVRLLDRVNLVRHTPGGHSIDAELWVQGIHHTIAASGNGDYTAGTWEVTLETTSAAMVRDGSEWDRGLWDQAQWGI